MACSLATYNVLDLFDAPARLMRAHLDAKLAHLAAVLSRANADVVALQEVGSAEVVRELVSRVPALGYREPIVGTADARGIRCALISRLPVLSSAVHVVDSLAFPVFVAGDPAPFPNRIPLRRGIVSARIDAGSLGTIDVFVAHFKSSRALPLRDANGEISPVTERDAGEAKLRTLVWRGAEALFVRGLVDAALGDLPSRHVVVAGDLNDHPDSTVVRIVSGGGPAGLLSCADSIPPASRFSILHHGEPRQIDHILATRLLRQRLHGARFLNDGLRDHSAFDDDAAPAPDSDHAPLVVTFA